ncbi:MAG: ABC transporter ATP-binding protein [Methylotenera sp.]|nr:ABC transporter ATP-binding protein [Oligoflexia bacterium]
MKDSSLQVDVRGVCKSYRQGDSTIEVLSGVDLEVGRGETVAITGQSGSGKSTLLSLLAGLDQPTRGTIQIGGQEISTLGEAALADFRSRNLGIIFQQFHLMSNLTALENVSLPLEISRDAEFKTRSRKALQQVGLSHRENHMPSQLSGGERQRVAIARAFVVQPSLLLADEPSGSLDTKTGRYVMDLLFDLARSEMMTLILVTHSDELARRCDRQWVLEQGRLSVTE